MIRINSALIAEIALKSKASPRKRANYNFHKDYNAPVQRMLNAAQPGTYVRPHKHENPDKVEAFVILGGKALVVEFDDKGHIAEHIILDARRGEYAVEIPPKIWHSFIALLPDTVLYEVKDGPYNKDVDKNFAPWAPEEGTTEAQDFNKNILEQLKLK
ncbi:MAG: WbuC family cupin fold metalloprotein [Candidatus Omnitrophota bacterium]